MISSGRWLSMSSMLNNMAPQIVLPLLRRNYINRCLNLCLFFCAFNSSITFAIWSLSCAIIIILYLTYSFMDSNSSSFLMNPSTVQSVYYRAKEEDRDNVIDLGLSLRTLQPDAYHPSGHLVSMEGYDDLIDWPQSNINLKSSNIIQSRSNFQEDCEEDGEGIQSKERWAYVKVNMDGVIVGRKVCILDHGSYSSLALQLEDMFGRQSVSGLRLFQSGSEFSLVYKDRYENWRSVGDVPWKEFVECVKRLRIARKSTNGSALLS